ncbi:MAG: WD40 repeat domain-containing protein, partial [Cyanobium sp.]
MAEPQEGIHQEISEVTVAATSATGNATIHISNYYYREQPQTDSTPAAQPNAELPCPYRGLFHFGPNDAELFFGRDAVVESLLQAIQTRAFLPLLGASGSGKTSVVLAGLVPRLQREGHWRFSHFRPGADPFHALALALVPLYAPELNATDRMAQARQLADFLRSGAVPLADVLTQVRQNDPGERVLVIADQFEELYTQGTDDSVQRAFLDALLAGFSEAANQTRGLAGDCARLVLTMRADFLGNALSYRPFADLLQQGDFKLGPMNAAELREVMEKPARGVAFESGLVERILEEVKAEPGTLPLLEFALTELWDRREDQTLTHGAYTAIGGVEGALARHADASYAALTPAEQQVARRVFLQLVRPGEGTEDTRRRASRQELGAVSWELVKRLADARLVVTNRVEDAAVETVEVVHEALIRHWGELRGWMVSDRKFRTWQERLRSDLTRWENSRRDEGLLLRSVALAEGQENLNKREGELSPAEREFIVASAAATERAGRQERRRRRLLFSGLAGGLAVVSVALLLAWGQLVRAQRQRGEALAVTAKLTATSRPADALLEALAAAGFSRYGQPRPAESLLPAAATEALLDGAARSREQLRLRGHQGWVRSAAYSADGSRIVSAGDDGTVRQWEAKSGRAIGEPLRGHQGWVVSAAYSADGSRIVSAGEDGTVRQWEAKNGRAIGEPLRGHQGAVYSAAYSADGSRIVSAGDDGRVRQWEAKSGRAIGEPLRGHQGLVWSAAYSA